MNVRNVWYDQPAIQKEDLLMNDGLGPEGSYYEAKAREEAQRRAGKKDAYYPLVITIMYLVLGFGFGLWHPGWLLFLTIPLHYIHFRSFRQRMTHPVMLTLIYLILGFYFDLWHPGWMIFLAVPFCFGKEK